MKKIGEGYYYSVYELSSTRVLKRQTSIESKLAKLKIWYERTPELLSDKISSPEESAAESLELSKKLANLTELKEILGNPVFTNEHEYEQDRAVPLGELLDSKNADAFLSYMQEYVDVNLLLWKFSYAEVVHNFTLNAGVSAVTGRVILFDFNDVSQSKEKVAEAIEVKRWLTQASMRDLKKTHPVVHARIEALFDSAFTLTALRKHWAEML